MTCKNCGHTLKDGTTLCPGCGAPVKSNAAMAPARPVAEVPTGSGDTSLSTTAMILGIVSFVLTFVPFLAWGALITSIIGLCFASKATKSAKAENRTDTPAVLGLTFSIIALVISAIPLLVSGVILLCVVGFVIFYLLFVIVVFVIYVVIYIIALIVMLGSSAFLI